MRSSLFLLAFALSATALPAQTSSYTSFGAGCKGSGSGGYCAGVNTSGGTLRSKHNVNTFALPFTARATMAVLGFELFTKSTSTTPVVVTTEVYAADSLGKPTGKPLRSGKMVVGPAATFWKTTFSPLLIKSGTKHFISWKTSPLIWFPFVTTGSRGTHYWHGPTQSSWNGPFNSVNWSWRLNCAGSTGGIPVLSAKGLPGIGKSFTVELARARPNTAALLSLGASNTSWGTFRLPLDLTPAGASGCKLLASLDVFGVRTTSASGTASVPFPIPNQTGLLGVRFYNQWIVVDQAANAFGFAFSNGGVAQIGR